MRRTYTEVRVGIEAQDLAAAETALLLLGASGTAQETLASPNPWIEVTGYFATGTGPRADELTARIAELRDPERRQAHAPRIEIGECPWQDWVTQTRAALTVLMVTPRLRILPPWERERVPRGEAGVDDLVIEPGEAFGTGRHATTRGCLELLDAVAATGLRGPALDAGTGTAILALRAAQLGFSPLIAFDSDPIAATAARENLRLNDMLGRVQLFAGEMCALAAGPGGARDAGGPRATSATTRGGSPVCLPARRGLALRGRSEYASQASFETVLVLRTAAARKERTWDSSVHRRRPRPRRTRHSRGVTCARRISSSARRSGN